METRTNSIRDLSTKLQKQGSIYWLAVGDGNVLYIGAYLKNIAELEAPARYVKEQAEMPEPNVGITISPIPPFLKNAKFDSALCELDYKIINQFFSFFYTLTC